MCLFYFIDCCSNMYQNFPLEKLLKKKNKTKQTDIMVRVGGKNQHRKGAC